MRSFSFVKMQGSGNDFIVFDARKTRPIVYRPSSIVQLCDRKFGIGADGILLIEKSKQADARMRIFNADGSEAEMCGNGARCAALYVSHKSQGTSHKKMICLETKAGVIEAEVRWDVVKIRLTDPTDVKLDLPVPVGKKIYNVDFINTGVPHVVVEVDDLESVCVKEIGRALRRHKVFSPAGTNVNFVGIDSVNSVSVRTYERGVEDETLACGTGSVASAIISVLNHGTRGESQARHRVLVKTRGGETLAVYFKVSKYQVTDVWLEGRAQTVFSGVLHG